MESNEDRLKLINTGVKMFVRADGKGSGCEYRLAQEGAQATVPFLKKRLLELPLKDMLMMLSNSEIAK